MSEANPRIGSIERVGSDGFIVHSDNPDDPSFYGGKRLFPNFDHLLRFLAQHLGVQKAEGAVHGIPGGNGRQFVDTSLPKANQ